MPNSNRTQPDKVMPQVEDMFSCNLCEFETENKNELEHHMNTIHGASIGGKAKEVNISKCVPPVAEFTNHHSSDKNVGKEVRFAGEEVEEVVAENVEEVVHETLTDKVTESEPVLSDQTYICDDCGIGVNYNNACIEHMKSHSKANVFECIDCEIQFETEVEFEWHKTEHNIVSDSFTCSKCDFKSSTQEEVNEHLPNHSSPEVNIPTAEQSISCSQCEYKCTLDIDLKNHIQLKHKKETKYWCTECKFVTNYVANTWEHTLAEHPDSSFEFNPKQMDNLVLKLVAEQNADIVEEMESMKREIKDAFDKLSGLVETTLGSLKNDTNEKCKTLANAVMKIYEKTSKVKLRTKSKGNSNTRIKPVSSKITFTT